MPRVLIDGYNLLTASDYPDRDSLLLTLSKYAKTKHLDVTIVFDGTHDGTGQGERTRIGGVDVWFTPLTVTADDEIEEVLEKPDGGRWIVVSSDRRIQKAAIRSHATYVEVTEFLSRLNQTSTVEPSLEKSPWMEGREEEFATSKRSPSRKRQKLSKTERKRKERMKKL